MGFFLPDPHAKDVAEIARRIVADGIAPDAAVGWAMCAPGKWAHRVGICSSAERPIFDLASLTKPMTAVAIALSPRLTKETRLADVVTSVSATASASIPIELLLAHRAGLEAHLELHRPLLEGKPIDHEASLRYAANRRRADAPDPIPTGGFAPVYSDAGYILAGEALARAEETRDPGEAIEKLVVHPIHCGEDLGTARSLRARHADFAERVRPTENVPWRGGIVCGEVHDEDAWALTRDGASGHAGMFGTIEGVLRFGGLVLDSISAGDLEWLVRERPGGSLRAGFDGKSENGSSAGTIAGPRAFGHLGFTGTSIWIDPETRIIVACLTNRVHPTRENVAIRAARPEIHDALFGLALRT